MPEMSTIERHYLPITQHPHLFPIHFRIAEGGPPVSIRLLPELLERSLLGGVEQRLRRGELGGGGGNRGGG